VVDFGLRRMHGIDAGLKAARAFHIAGVDATSRRTTMNTKPSAFARVFPDTALLVDTYDTLAGVSKVVQLAKELGSAFRISAVRLDSGDLCQLAFGARRILDDAGLRHVEVFASGNLNEDEIARLVAAGAPINGFGVGTDMGVSRDAPALDIAYKLVEYAG